jgi:hypothetical protein
MGASVHFAAVDGGNGIMGASVLEKKEKRRLALIEGYRPLLAQIVKFFRTGKAPVRPQETIEIYAFMSAADKSKNNGGIPIALEIVLSEARKGEEI